MSKAKYRKGERILSLDELAKQDFVYFDNKVYHTGWFGSWQLRFASRHIGNNGRIFYAERIHPDKIVCKKCGRRFADKTDLKLFMEVWDGPDDLFTLDYDRSLTDEKGVEVFRGCPYCRTDAYLMDLEVENNEN